ncbi:MAG: hypothetical protein HWQ35_15140 [Nostoc sp. NMS1]|uniref:hypothetical protein n=1 Tax=unclassified Nostoc TaxID=2593658 RepID=UPI0025CD5845|nr:MULTISPECIES: hypothetical protein [unclassified Nostoc]MBN3907841.1 hypothetical protein [Nostoc sp. NMS1]MBN3991148.1 hypothetical protein [Nostoc sp. NMS2]
MASTSNVQITIALQNSDLDDDELQAETQRLLQQMLELDEVEDANLYREAEAPAGSKSFTGLVVGWLTAQVNAKNIKTVMGFLSDRLGNKTIELEIEANGKKLKVKASSRQELEAAIEAAQKFVAG